jgi:hypothetical protein
MKIDMSPRAITARLRLVSELRALCLALGKAKPLAGDAVKKTPPPRSG